MLLLFVSSENAACDSSNSKKCCGSSNPPKNVTVQKKKKTPTHRRCGFTTPKSCGSSPLHRALPTAYRDAMMASRDFTRGPSPEKPRFVPIPCQNWPTGIPVVGFRSKALRNGGTGDVTRGGRGGWGCETKPELKKKMEVRRHQCHLAWCVSSGSKHYDQVSTTINNSSHCLRHFINNCPCHGRIVSLPSTFERLLQV